MEYVIIKLQICGYHNAYRLYMAIEHSNPIKVLDGTAETLAYSLVQKMVMLVVSGRRGRLLVEHANSMEILIYIYNI